MSAITQHFQPPLYWQQFEDLTVGVFRFVFNDPAATKFGGLGQAQNGVDVYGHVNGNGVLFGVQCKRMEEVDENNNPRPGGPISRQLLEREIEKARNFSPLLDADNKIRRWSMAFLGCKTPRVRMHSNVEKLQFASGFGFEFHFIPAVAEHCRDCRRVSLCLLS